MKIAQSVEEIQENPTQYGMPTFDEFIRNKEKYLGRHDEVLASIDAGDRNTGAIQKYYIETDCGTIRLDSLEQAERIAIEMGLSIHNESHFKVDPQYQHGDIAGKHYINVTFRPKHLLLKRANW